MYVRTIICVCMYAPTYITTVHQLINNFIFQFYPFGLSENDSVLTNVDDVTSQPIMLSETFYFYGQAINVVYVS